MPQSGSRKPLKADRSEPTTTDLSQLPSQSVTLRVGGTVSVHPLQEDPSVYGGSVQRNAARRAVEGARS